MMKLLKLKKHAFLPIGYLTVRTWHVVSGVLVFVVVCYDYRGGVLKVNLFEHFLFALFQEFYQVLRLKVSKYSIWYSSQVIQASWIAVFANEDELQSAVRILVQNTFDRAVGNVNRWSIWIFFHSNFWFIILEKDWKFEILSHARKAHFFKARLKFSELLRVSLDEIE